MIVLTSKQRQAQATRSRLLDGAFKEFQQHGLAGGRVDRIAELASANKRLIYVYFGDKEQLFDAVVVRHLESMIDAVPFEVDDLPGYAAKLFDYLEERPTVLRLFAWRNLERAQTSEVEQASYRAKVTQIAEAQRAGRISSSLPAAHLLAAIIALVQSWATSSPALHQVSDEQASSPDRRRDSVCLGAARLVAA